MKTPKREEPVRRAGDRRRVMPREILGLQFIAEAQPVTTAHYAAYLSISRPVAWRSLRKLKDRELVRAHAERMEGENRYTLSPAGATLLARAFAGTPEDYRVPKGSVRENAHHEAVVDVVIDLTLALARSTRLRLVKTAWEHALRLRLGDRAKDALVPDAVLVVADTSGQERAYLVELDLATENASLLAKKYRQLSAERRAGTPLLGIADWSVLVVAPSTRRVNILARAAWDQAEVAEGLFYFAARPDLTSRTILTAGWRTPREVAEETRMTTESPFEAVRTECADGSNGLSCVSVREDTGSGGALGDRFAGVTP